MTSENPIIGQLIRRVARPVAETLTYRIRTGPAKGMRRRGGFGWIPPALKKATPEHGLLLDLDLAGLTVYDVGAFEGVMTMFFARAVGPNGQVHAFEPNPRNHRRVLENIALNRLQNVMVHNTALGSEPGRATLTFDPGQPGWTSAARRREAATGLRAIAVDLTPLDQLVSEQDLRPPDFLKIDVERMELPVLRGAESVLRRWRPELLIEIHGTDTADKRANACDVVGFLLGLGYRISHVESGAAVDAGNCEVAAVGHLHCTHPEGRARPPS